MYDNFQRIKSKDSTSCSMEALTEVPSLPSELVDVVACLMLEIFKVKAKTRPKFAVKEGPRKARVGCQASVWDSRLHWVRLRFLPSFSASIPLP